MSNSVKWSVADEITALMADLKKIGNLQRKKGNTSQLQEFQRQMTKLYTERGKIVVSVIPVDGIRGTLPEIYCYCIGSCIVSDEMFSTLNEIFKGMLEVGYFTLAMDVEKIDFHMLVEASNTHNRKVIDLGLSGVLSQEQVNALKEMILDLLDFFEKAYYEKKARFYQSA